ncbi:Uncharacterized protein Rs2_01321 [Raphanus sativus]|nr:Uncharacterized protein Rs2_01321 [Raphanus sativus]
MANEFTTVGWILRDDRGGFFGAASMKMRSNQVGSALIGEAYAFLFALQSMWMKGWRKVWFEGDNLELTRIVNTKAWHLELGNLMYDIRYWISRLPQCSLEQVNRERNQAADIISRKALEYDSMFIYYNSVPSFYTIFAECIQDVSVNGQNALHLADMNDRSEIVQVLLTGCIQRKIKRNSTEIRLRRMPLDVVKTN